MELNVIQNKTDELLKEKDFILIAIDGRCGAGKSTLAMQLQKLLSCNVIHMDDFFLRPEQRTQERLEVPGENVDHERFFEEVIKPLSKNEAFSYRPYCCAQQKLCEAIKVSPSRITIVEGSYSCHPKLWDYYDLHIFADVDYDEQIRRITARNGEAAAQVFKEKWIPLEEKYFEAYSVKERCELVLKIPGSI